MDYKLWMLEREVMGWIWGVGFGLNRRDRKEFEEGDDLVANQDTEDSWVLVVCFGEVASGKMGKMVKK